MEKPMVNHRFWLPICTKKRMVQVWRVAWLTADWSSAATKVGTSRVPSRRREKKRLQPPVIRVPQEPGETWGKTEPTSKHHQTYGFHESSGSLESPFAQLFAHWPWGMRSPGGEPIGNGRWPDAHKMLLDLRLKTAASTCCSSQLLRCTDAGWCGKGGIYIYIPGLGYQTTRPRWWNLALKSWLFTTASWKHNLIFMDLRRQFQPATWKSVGLCHLESVSTTS